MRKRPDPPAPAIEESEPGFLSRWSRRKHEARSGEQREPQPTPLQQPEPSVQVINETQPDTPLTDADLPPLETLDQHSDYSGFLAPGVSEDLRRRALRQLFAGSKFHFRDGLDDYDEDYRSFESLGGLFTADMRHRLEQQAERLRRAGGAGEADTQPEAEPASGANNESSAHATDAADSEPGGGPAGDESPLRG